MTKPAYHSIEINAHNLIFLTLLVIGPKLPEEPLNIYLFNSQPCEAMFRNARALSGVYSSMTNFTVADFIRRAEKIAVLTEIKTFEQSNTENDHLVFPVHHKHKKDDLFFSFNQTKLSDLKMDIIEQIVLDSYKEAQLLADQLKMTHLLKQKKTFQYLREVKLL